MYADLLNPWFELFDRKKLLVLSYDELLNSPGTIQWRVRQFLGVPKGKFPGKLPQVNTPGKEKTKEIPPKAKEVLGALFAKKNQELYDLLKHHHGREMEQFNFPAFKTDY